MLGVDQPEPAQALVAGDGVPGDRPSGGRAAMISLVEHAGEGRTPVQTAWVLGASVGATVATVSVACIALPVDEFHAGMRRWIAPVFGAAAAVVLALSALQSAPIVLVSGISVVL